MRCKHMYSVVYIVCGAASLFCREIAAPVQEGAGTGGLFTCTRGKIINLSIGACGHQQGAGTVPGKFYF